MGSSNKRKTPSPSSVLILFALSLSLSLFLFNPLSFSAPATRKRGRGGLFGSNRMTNGELEAPNPIMRTGGASRAGSWNKKEKSQITTAAGKSSN